MFTYRGQGTVPRVSCPHLLLFILLFLLAINVLFQVFSSFNRLQHLYIVFFFLQKITMFLIYKCIQFSQVHTEMFLIRQSTWDKIPYLRYLVPSLVTSNCFGVYYFVCSIISFSSFNKFKNQSFFLNKSSFGVHLSHSPQ